MITLSVEQLSRICWLYNTTIGVPYLIDQKHLTDVVAVINRVCEGDR